MKPRSESPVLDLIFPPEECVWQEEAETYLKHNYVVGQVNYGGWVAPDLAYYDPRALGFVG